LTKRGDIVVVALAGDYGKPRPALVVQSDLDMFHLPSVVVCPMTSTLRENVDQFRVLVSPDTHNGLRVPSHVMIDKISAIPRERLGPVIGHVEEAGMDEVTRRIAVLLGIA
jgi:mRNA interferase MazF